ncbi:MAG: ferritin-like domain-containing protein [Ginsengibacter sp.]
MKTSKAWIEHFKSNAKINRIDWLQKPKLTAEERENILSAMRAWQLGETSDGAHLLKAANRYAKAIGDSYYVEAVELFIKEEQKHGNNLGRYLDEIGEQRLKKNWADTMFRKVRYYNSSMELWTLAVMTVESAAQVFYQALKDATECNLLKQICRDILIDEAFHIDFQCERFQIIYESKGRLSKHVGFYFYRYFYFAVITLVWFAYGKTFIAGKNDFRNYQRKMNFKFNKTIGRLKENIQGEVKPASIVINNQK